MKQTHIFGDNGGCRNGRNHEGGLCSHRNAIRPNGRSTQVNRTAALRAVARGALSGFSLGISQKAPSFVRACGFSGLRRHHGG